MATEKPAGLTQAQKVGLGVGLTATAGAAAGAYFLYGSKNAAKNRKTVKSWVLKAKAEVLEKLEQAKEMSQEEYEQIIEAVTATYGQLKEVSKVDVSGFKKEMKDHWKAIAKSSAPKKTAKKVVKKSTKATPAVAKTVAKKTVKKAVSK